MQGVGTRGLLGRLDAQGRRPDGMSTQRRIQTCDLRLVRPVPQTHPAHQAQSEILADAGRGKGRPGTSGAREVWTSTADPGSKEISWTSVLDGRPGGSREPGVIR